MLKITKFWSVPREEYLKSHLRRVAFRGLVAPTYFPLVEKKKSLKQIWEGYIAKGSTVGNKEVNVKIQILAGSHSKKTLRQYLQRFSHDLTCRAEEQLRERVDHSLRHAPSQTTVHRRGDVFNKRRPLVVLRLCDKTSQALIRTKMDEREAIRYHKSHR